MKRHFFCFFQHVLNKTNLYVKYIYTIMMLTDLFLFVPGVGPSDFCWEKTTALENIYSIQRLSLVLLFTGIAKNKQVYTGNICRFIFHHFTMWKYPKVKCYTKIQNALTLTTLTLSTTTAHFQRNLCMHFL